ncbi:unnamed protein product [Bemisia tabaci]|uniref:Uncharacterized protein n=1 Tax=Bemisia tabaci TaxID=7038 RepID=A0A9P0A5E8_BEMTA|nr:unnamed protein product [Bemisia tabaci]
MKTVARHSCGRSPPHLEQVRMNPELLRPLLQSVPRAIEHQKPLSQRINDVIDYYLNLDSSSIFDANEQAHKQIETGKLNGNSSTNYEHRSAVEPCRRGPEATSTGNERKKETFATGNGRKKTLPPVSEVPSSLCRPQPPNPRLKKRLPVFNTTAESKSSGGRNPQEQSVSEVIRKWNLDPSLTGNGSQKRTGQFPETAKTGNRHLEMKTAVDMQKIASPPTPRACSSRSPPKCLCPEGSPILVRPRDPKVSFTPKRSVDSAIKQSDRSVIGPPEKRQQKPERSVTKPQDPPRVGRPATGNGSPKPETTRTGSQLSKVHEPKPETENGDTLSLDFFRVPTSRTESLSNLLTREDCLCHAAVHKSISGVMQSCLDSAPSGSALENPSVLAKTISNATRVLHREDTVAPNREPETGREDGESTGKASLQPEVESPHYIKPEALATGNRKPETESPHYIKPEVLATGNRKPEVESPYYTKPEVVVAGDRRPEVELPHDTKPEVLATGNRKPEVESPHYIKPEVLATGNRKPEVESPYDTRPEVMATGNRKPEVESPYDTKPDVVVAGNHKPEVESLYATKPEVESGVATDDEKNRRPSLKPEVVSLKDARPEVEIPEDPGLAPTPRDWMRLPCCRITSC